MIFGSNVKLDIFYGDESIPTIPTNSTFKPSDWNSSHLFSWLYKNPGNYTLKVNISNRFSSYLLSYRIAIITEITDLIPGLSRPTVKILDSAFAYFKFSYKGLTKSGWNANVTYWPGDELNATFGPFSLGMDFADNSSKSQLSYDYKYTGSYQATFFIENFLGSRSYKMSVLVKNGIEGLYLDCATNILNNASFIVKVYLVFGTKTTNLGLTIGNWSNATPRKCNLNICLTISIN
jgi:hypothetical protein